MRDIKKRGTMKNQLSPHLRFISLTILLCSQCSVAQNAIDSTLNSAKSCDNNSNLLIITLIVTLLLLISRSISRNRSVVLKNYPGGDKQGRKLGLLLYKDRAKSFNEKTFLSKAERLFILLQDAWSEKDLTDVRPFLSDGIWQELTTQFCMMNALHQTNRYSNSKVIRTFIDSVESDDNFDTITVGIEATRHHYFKCEFDSSFDSNSSEHFVEFWSFIRKRDASEINLYSTFSCPNCSTPLNASLGEQAICPQCSTLINGGDYDWVVSKMAQADDFTHEIVLEKQEHLHDKRANLEERYPYFSVQKIEDIARNAFMQILISNALNEPERIRRFLSDSLFEKKYQYGNSNSSLINQLNMNSVSLLAATIIEGVQYLYVGITYSGQRVRINANNRLIHIDGAVHAQREVMRLEHRGEGTSQGKLYMHSCSSCGNNFYDSLNINCSNCGAVFNDNQNEWIVSDILTPAEYRKQLMSESTFDFAIDTEVLDGLLSVKDYVISNIIATIACDGDIDDNEIIYLKKIAKQLHYSKADQENIIKMAHSSNSTIRMPENMQQREKIYQLMKKAAKADNKVVAEEKELLKFVKEKYLNRS